MFIFVTNLYSQEALLEYIVRENNLINFPSELASKLYESIETIEIVGISENMYSDKIINYYFPSNINAYEEKKAYTIIGRSYFSYPFKLIDMEKRSFLGLNSSNTSLLKYNKNNNYVLWNIFEVNKKDFDMHSIVIFPGVRNRNNFKKYNRIKTLLLQEYDKDGHHNRQLNFLRIELKDEYKYYVINAPNGSPGGEKGISVKLCIEDVYPGSMDSDKCYAEVVVTGYYIEKSNKKINSDVVEKSFKRREVLDNMIKTKIELDRRGYIDY